MKLTGWQRVLLILIPFLLVSGIFQFAGALLFNIPLYANGEMTSLQKMVLALFNLMGTITIVWFFVCRIDHEPFKRTGLMQPTPIAGLGIAAVLTCAMFVVGFFFLEWWGELNFVAIQFDFAAGFYLLVAYLAIAILEELLFRGYVLRNLLRSLREATALILSSCLFSIFHLLNLTISWLGAINIFLVGLLFGIAYLCYRSLWLPVCIHFFWNFSQSLLGFRVSGQDAYSMIVIDLPEKNSWNGGDFGFEGSILAVLFQLVGIALLWRFYKKKKGLAG